MKNNRTLTNELSELVRNLTDTQKANWRKLIQFMREKDGDYSQNEFDASHYNNGCSLGYAIAAGIIAVIEDVADNHFSNYDTALDEAFGPNAYDLIFSVSVGGDEDLEPEDYHDFPDICYHIANIRDMDNTTSAKVAKALEYIFDLGNNYSKVTIHWKSNQKDNFKSVESLKEYLELNPHRRNGYRKITATKLVERIVYDEVTETIEL